jgi:hypothetical protein
MTPSPRETPIQSAYRKLDGLFAEIDLAKSLRTMSIGGLLTARAELKRLRKLVREAQAEIRDLRRS